MGRALAVAVLCLLALRVQFGLLRDAAVLDPLFVGAVYAALVLRGAGALWLAAALGLAGDWVSGTPLGFEGAALTATAYLAFRAARHLLVSSRGPLFLLALLLFVVHEALRRLLDLALGLGLGLPFSPPLAASALLSALAAAALGFRHEERTPV